MWRFVLLGSVWWICLVSTVVGLSYSFLLLLLSFFFTYI